MLQIHTTYQNQGKKKENYNKKECVRNGKKKTLHTTKYEKEKNLQQLLVSFNECMSEGIKTNEAKQKTGTQNKQNS